MVVSLRTVRTTLMSHMLSTGHFTGGVSGGEPSEPVNGLHGSVWHSDVGFDDAQTLSKTVETRTLIVRFYVEHFNDKRGEIEDRLDDAVSDFMSNVWGDYTLGGIVRNVHPTGTGVRYEYLQLAQTWYRTVTITLACIVDASATYSP